MENLARTDPEVAEAIREETRRQGAQLELIASENFVSEAVLEALGTVLTNKYAEGYPGKRYYGGCEFVDVAERLAIERAKRLFGADHANVQPHSGAQANMAVYLAVCKPGDTMVGMNLSHGGHLTHGHPLNFSGRFFNIVAYGVRKEDERIDYDEMAALVREHRPKMLVVGASAYPRIIDSQGQEGRRRGGVRGHGGHGAHRRAGGGRAAPEPRAPRRVRDHHHPQDPAGAPRRHGPLPGEVAKELDKLLFPGVQGGPLMHVIAAKAVALQEALEPGFKAYQAQIVANAKALAATLADEGWRLVSGGTDNHLMLVDVFSRGLTGKVAEAALDRAGITVNKNTIPFDTNSPMVASGIRIGTPALTTRGMKEREMETVGRLIARALRAVEDEPGLADVKKDVGRLCERFPLYASRLQSATTARWPPAPDVRT